VKKERKRKLKVFWTDHEFHRGRQIHLFVAASSMKEVAGITGHSLYCVQTYWSDTENDEEVSIALSKPGTVFYKVPSSRKLSDRVTSYHFPLKKRVFKPLPYDESDFD
jgi:hypothetical protein